MKWTRCIVDGCKRRALSRNSKTDRVGSLFCGYHYLTLSVSQKLKAVNARFHPSRP